MPYRAMSEQKRLERFHQKTMPVPFCGCIIWLASTTPSGYGCFFNGKRVVPAHRFIYEKAVRPLSVGDVVCHKCDTPACVNPEHLFVGTMADNSADMTRKRRHWTYSFNGDMSPFAKLNEEKVAEIRILLSRGLRHRDIADRFDVHKSTISLINTGKIWVKPTGVDLVGTRYE